MLTSGVGALKGLEGSFAAIGLRGQVRAANVPESAGRGG